MRRDGRRRSTCRLPDHGLEGGLGRATGERLCRQRGRLTPRDAGSSAKPLPNPTQGYDDDAAADDAANVSDHPKNCLTKEDSFRTPPSVGHAWLVWAGFVVRLLRVELLPSAFKHGIIREDIEHAARNAW